MRNAAILALCWACSALAATADDTAKLVELGTYFSSANGQLSILLTGDQAVWQNGVRLPYFPHPECGMLDQIFLKAGDSLLLGGADGFTRYRLERLSANESTFAISRYASDRVAPHHYRPGARIETESAIVSLPLEIFDDSQRNLVQLGRGPAARTK